MLIIKSFDNVYRLTFDINISGNMMFFRLLVTTGVEASVSVCQVVYDQFAAVFVHPLHTWLYLYR